VKSFFRYNVGRRGTGGLAALYLALAYLMAMPYFLVVSTTPASSILPRRWPCSQITTQVCR
jgi:hypothetical protein